MTEINGKIYKFTSPSGRVYIGQTIDPIEKRWGKYKTLNCKQQPKLYNSLVKYGYENHIKEVIMTGITTQEMLNWYEIFYIAVYDSYKNGLNSTLGGEGTLKPIEELKYGMRSGDKGYSTARSKGYSEANPEKVKAQRKAYNEAHKEEHKRWWKIYSEEHKEEIKAWNKAWREANEERIKAKQKAYRDAHLEECKARSKAYYETHKEEKKALNKAYYEAYKEEKLAKQKARREANPERVRAIERASYERHKEEKRAQRKASYERHKEEMKIKHKAYRDAHKDEQKAYREREREIYTSYGYTQKQWQALSAEERAQMRKEYDLTAPKQTTLF